MNVSDAQRLKTVEAENTKLKKLLANSVRAATGRVVLLDLNGDGVSFPLAALDSELPLPGTELKDGNLGTDDAKVFNTLLGTLQPVCSCCLHTIVEVGAGGDCDCR